MDQEIDFRDFNRDLDIQFEEHKINTLIGILFIVIWLISIFLFQQN
jgi:hypothetical protein